MVKRMWDIKESAEAGTLNMYIYGDVEGDSYDWWSDEVTRSETSANYFREELAKHENTTQINLYINSYGGSVFEGTAIYNQLKRHPAHKTVYIDGFACSVASVIAMAGDEIVAMLEKVHGVKSLEDIGFTPDMKEKTARVAPYIRDRITFLRILKFYDFYDDVIK